MSLNLSLKARKPTRVLLRPWEALIEASKRNARDRNFSDCYFDPFAGAVLLDPYTDPSRSIYGKDGYTLRVYNGSSWVVDETCWFEGQSAFGDNGGYVAFSGNSTYPLTTPWEAYRSGSLPIGANRPIAFNLFWTPPAGVFLPSLEFFPRVDMTTYADLNGYRYYFCPLGFYIDGTNSALVVCEYEYDSLEQFAGNPASMLTKTYQHPLDMGVQGLGGLWATFKLIPVLEQYTSAEDEEVYYYHDFLLLSPLLKHGGFCYRTKIKRRSLSLFPEGVPGIRSLTGGAGVLNICPIYFPDSGYVVSRVFSKRENNTDWVTVNETSYKPSGTTITHQIVDPDTLVAIVGGETFQRFRVKSTLTSETTGNFESPILYSVQPSLEGSAEDRTQTEVDISAHVNIRESTSEEATGYRATITLFNSDGSYNALAFRPVNEVVFSYGGTNRAVLYTEDPGFRWYQAPTKEALTLTWEGGDFFTRMKGMYISGHPDYGNQSAKAAITAFMQNIGFDTARLHIDDTLDTLVFLPRSPDKDDPLSRPQDGSTADEFLTHLHETWFSDYRMYFSVDDVGGVLKPALYIEAPPDPNDPDNLHRLFYLSREQASAAEEADPYYCVEPEVSFLHSQYRNEIWVFGMDPATKRPIVDCWMDARSQTDESYEYYVGERRLLVVVTRLPSVNHVTWYLNRLVWLFGRLRRQITFRTKYDPTLRPGDYIRFYGLSLVYQVTGTEVDIAPGNVSASEDDTTHNCRVEAVQYPF